MQRRSSAPSLLTKITLPPSLPPLSQEFKTAKGKRKKDLTQRTIHPSHILLDDITLGREAIPIPAINEGDSQPFPEDCIYVNKPVPGT